MKLDVFVRFAFISLALTGCLATEKSQTETSPADIVSLKLDNVSSIFRGPDFEPANTLSDEYYVRNSDLKYLFSLGDDGKYRRLRYIDSNGDERDLKVFVDHFNRISQRYLLIQILQGGDLMQFNLPLLIDLQTGSIRKMDSYGIRVQDAVLFGGFIFAFSNDLKSLMRIDPATGSSFTYLALPSSKSFMTGNRFPVSTSQFWWDDDGSVANESKNFRALLIDENLNVLADVRSEDTQTFAVNAIMANGNSFEIPGFTQLNHNNLITFVNSNDSKLYVAHTISGPYIHNWISSPDADDVDLTLSRVSISATGLIFNQVQQLFPYITLPHDSRHIMCRSDYTLDSDLRYVMFPSGVMKIDATNSVPNFSFSAIPLNMNSLLFPQADKPSNSCYISGHWIYYRNLAGNKILRRDLESPAVFSEETVVTRAGIESFYVLGDRVHYSTSAKAYKVKVNGSDDGAFAGDPQFKFKDLINFH